MKPTDSLTSVLARFRARDGVRIFRVAPALLLASLLAACSTAGHPSKSAQAIAVRRTPVFAHGPAQSSAPDFELASGQRVMLLSMSYGYAQIKTSDGQTGYVQRGTLRPAPDLPLPVIPRGRMLASVNPGMPERGRLPITPGSPLFDVNDFGDALPQGAAGDPTPKLSFKFRTGAVLR